MLVDTGQSVKLPTGAHSLDEERLLRYLQTAIEGFPSQARLDIRQFKHGQSNPTYLLQAGTTKYVLRKKPPGQVLASAHAVEREFKVLAALSATSVPVPRALCLCDDVAVVGTSFYVMEHVQGRIFVDPSCPELSPAERRNAYRSMVTVLAGLHAVHPASVGLQGFGRAGGYCARQVRRWGQQYRAQLTGAPLPEMEHLSAWLQCNIPAADADASQARIAHGDYRLDNLVFPGETTARVLAVLDWELATIGPPLADLAYSALPYHLPSGGQGMAALPTPLPPGIPSEAEYVTWYCAAGGLAPPQPREWSFYLALALFRAAAILAGVGARARLGNASSENARQVGANEVVRELARRALHIIHSSDTALRSVYAALGSGGQPQSPALVAGDASGPAAPASTSALHVQPNRGVADALAPGGFGPSPRAAQLLEQLRRFMDEHVIPSEPAFEELAASDKRWTVHPRMEELKALARAAGLWNLWIAPGLAAHIVPLLPPGPPPADALLLGAGLSNLDYAHLAEAMGRCVFASEVFNCSAPDTGNMEVLARYGTPTQQRAWLLPLLRGEIRSCFAMTEPAVASSDATNVQASILREGNEYVLQGHKWWASGAMDPRCALAIFMGKSDTGALPHRQQSMVLVPMAAPGVRVLRPLSVFGYDDAPHGHAEVLFKDVRVPASNMLLGEGRGFEIAQGRLGPGRLHHCMRAIGMGERALELMAARGSARTAFGRPLALHGAFAEEFARRRIDLDAARLTVLNAAHALDQIGAKQARGQIAAAKVLAPGAVLRALDAAVQAHGGAGVCDDTPLARLWAGARTLRIADGPDAVHLAAIAKLELGQARPRL